MQPILSGSFDQRSALFGAEDGSLDSVERWSTCQSRDVSLYQSISPCIRKCSSKGCPYVTMSLRVKTTNSDTDLNDRGRQIGQPISAHSRNDVDAGNGLVLPPRRGGEVGFDIFKPPSQVRPKGQGSGVRRSVLRSQPLEVEQKVARFLTRAASLRRMVVAARRR